MESPEILLAYSYEENHTRWTELYKPSARRSFDISAIRVNRRCKGCNSSHDLHRHHKANDYLFARIRPDRYAERYIQFRAEDINDLCRWCHEEFHRYFRIWHKHFFWDAVNYRFELSFKLGLTLKQCRSLKKKFLKIYTRWLRERRKENDL